MTRNLVLIPLAAALLLPGGQALAAPAQLLNKTVTTSATISANAKADDGTVATYPRTVQRTIYISSKGRLFVRVSRSTGRYSDTRERSPEETSQNMRFQGNKLVGVLKLQSGASQLVIDFEAGFTTCTVSFLFGREGGQAIRFKGLNGKMYTQQGGFNVSNQTCSIREGNPFAG